MLKTLIPVSLHYILSNVKHVFFGYNKYSQFGEDEVLLQLFKNKRKGRYVDVGSHHPYRYSNTYLLHKKGWHGANIDPNPHTIALFNKTRPHDENIFCGVGKEGTLTYYRFSDPAVNTFKKDHAEVWMGKSFLKFLGTTKVEVRPLSKIVQGDIDLLTIDTEGMDMEVLQSYDWIHYPRVIVIEGDESREFLIEKGYKLYKTCGMSRIYILGGVFIVYEEGHIEEAKERAEAGMAVICLDFLLEKECEKKGVAFIPLRKFVDLESEEEEWWKLSHDIPREWYRLPSMNFFTYKDIRIAEPPEPILQAYLAKIFYFVRIFIFLKRAYPGTIFSIPYPASSNISHDCLAAFQPWTVLDAACMTRLVGPEYYDRITPSSYDFEKENFKSRALKLYNLIISLVPKRRRKIYLSGYWMHAESLVPLLDDTELIILETKRFREISLRLLRKCRIRFMYSHGPVGRSVEKNALRYGREYAEKWKDVRQTVQSYLETIRTDIDWTPIADACEHIVTYAPRVIADIDTLFEIMKKEKPDLILQMASVGGAHHYFFLMAAVARQLSIPSIELQHATATIDPRSVFCRIETDYLLTYSESINEWHRKIGNTHKQLIPVGSPRFDRYVNERESGKHKGKEIFKKLGLDTTRPVLLVAVPFSETYVSAIDSYQLQEFLETVAEVQKNVPGLQICFKCRIPKLVEVTKKHLGTLFSHDWVVTGEEDIFFFICASDVVICNNSTIIYQAVLARKPLVLHPWRHFDRYHSEIYSPHMPLLYTGQEAVQALTRIFNDPTYRNELLRDQDIFLKGYLFDGKSSRRVAEFIKNLAL